MHKKIIVLTVIVFIAILGIVAVNSADNSNDLNKTTEATLNVSSEGPYALSKITNEIRTHPYYKGYDNETVNWMESLGDKYVFFSKKEIVIMDKNESDKIPSAFVEDAFFKEIFSCNVLENRSLGESDNLKDVLVVDNVEFISEEVHFPDI